MMLRSMDLETSIHTTRGVAQPWWGSDWIVSVGMFDEEHGYVEMRSGHTAPQDGWLRSVLAGCTVLAGHNIGFDLGWALYGMPKNQRLLDEWAAGGGVIWDTQIAEYALNAMAQSEHQLPLDEVSIRYGGTTKPDAVKALWSMGISTEHIEPRILSVYLQGDCENTFRIARQQQARCPAGMRNIMRLRMYSRLASVAYQVNGSAVDEKLGRQHAAELAADLGALQKRLREHLPAEVRDSFNFASYPQRSALLFGGVVHVPCREYQLNDGTYTTQENHPDQAYVQKEVSEDTGEIYKSGKNAGLPKLRKKRVPDLDKPKSRAGTRPVTLPRLTEPLPEWALSSGEHWQTGHDILAVLAVRKGIPPILEDMGKAATIQKDLGTYYVVTDADGNESGMLSKVAPDGCVHSQVLHCSTVTGRLSSRDPNLQNVSRGDKSRVKQLFVSRYPGGRIISADFRALEVYVQAAITGDKQLLQDLAEGVDLHTVRVAQTYGIPYEQAIKLTKGYVGEDGTKVPADPEWDQRRTDAKPVSFQRAYGASAEKIARSTGLALDVVEAIIKAECERYPQVEQYFEGLAKRIWARHEEKESMLQRHPEDPRILARCGVSVYPDHTGQTYTYPSKPVPKHAMRHGESVSISPTIIRNYSVQGGGATVMLAAMYILDVLLRSERLKDTTWNRVLVTNTIHDALYLDCPADMVDQAQKVLHKAMFQAGRLVYRLFKFPAQPGIIAELSIGPNQYDMEPI